MGTRRQQQMRILRSLTRNGWRQDFVERGRDVWVDEIWSLSSTSSPVGLKAWLAFLVDPAWKGPRRHGEGVCAVVADTVRRKERTGWLIEIPLGRRWERGLVEVIEALQASRLAKSPPAAVGKKPVDSIPKARPRVQIRWKHLR